MFACDLQVQRRVTTRQIKLMEITAARDDIKTFAP
jgi:hypothetical protein